MSERSTARRYLDAPTRGAVFTFNDPKTLLFFTRTPGGKHAAREYLARLRERTAGRDKPVTPGTYRAQLAAVHRWGLQVPADLSTFFTDSPRRRSTHPSSQQEGVSP